MDYWHDLRQIIGNHYSRQKSRYLAGGKKTASVWEYYYNLSDHDSARRSAALAGQALFSVDPDLDHISFQFYADRKMVKTRCDFLLKLKETAGFFELDFHAITGYETVKSYGKRPAVRLTFPDKPLLQLLFSKQHGDLLLKKTDGHLCPFRFSWWVNRLLRENALFRSLMTDIFKEIGSENGIFRDIARCIREDRGIEFDGFFAARV